MKQRKNNKDHVKEASRRLSLILRTSRKLAILPEDLARLNSVAGLKAACDRCSTKYNWPWIIFVCVLVGSLALYLTLSIGLSNGFDCRKNTSHMLPVHTIRAESALKLSDTKEPLPDFEENVEDSTVSSYPWVPSKLNLQRDR